MQKIIRCECGFVARAETENKVIQRIRDHMKDDHPALLDEVENEDLRGWIEVE